MDGSRGRCTFEARLCRFFRVVWRSESSPRVVPRSASSLAPEHFAFAPNERAPFELLASYPALTPSGPPLNIRR